MGVRNYLEKQPEEKKDKVVKKGMTITIDEKLIKKLDKKRLSQNRSRNYIIAKLIKEKL